MRLVANDPFFGNPGELHISTPPLPIALAEGDSAEITVRVIPRAAGEKNFGVMVTTDRFGPTQVRLSTVAEYLPPCSLEVSPAGALELRDAADGGVEGRVTFTNLGTTRCTVDHLRLNEAAAQQFTVLNGGATQMDIPGERARNVLIAGPKPVDAGVVGAFGFHVFQQGRVDQWIELRTP